LVGEERSAPLKGTNKTQVKQVICFGYD